ncbi:ABC transporter permease [Olivibacter sp. SDN3]|uniref:ABC transporter permease n=1 Tax=Olivibacter sp. SDN3 TaxID=2764720 RepID=UPI00165122BD|nr:ABC transporter permease [Olivibacter sp. SDN3]QNL48095.1 ABC transporter permease [Olivibacter sp. SDN3]
MLRNYFKIALRNLWKNKVFSLINIVGLSLGMASILTLTLLVNQYITRDAFHRHKERMYYLKTFTSDGNSYQQTTFPLLYEIENNCPEIEAITHWQNWDWFPIKAGENEVLESTIFVDPDFLKVFSFDLKEGNPDHAMQDNNSVVISQKVKRQLFADEPALGKTVLLSDSIPVTVTGVVDIPSNSSLRAEVFLPVQFLRGHNEGFEYAANWYNSFAENYLLLREGADPKQLDKKIAGIVKQHYSPENRNQVVKTVPFTQLKSEGGATIRKIIIGAVAASVFILLIVVVNLINLNMATLFTRAKEVAVRRIVGSTKKNIIMQFCIENGLIMIISLGLGFVVFKLALLSMLNELVGERLGEVSSIGQSYTVIFLLAAVALGVVFLAAGIPSLYLTSIKIREAIKGEIVKGMGRKRGMRNVFIATQFVLGITFLCMALILSRQIRYMKSVAPGFNTEEVMVANLTMSFKDPEQAEGQFNVILHSLQQNPYVKSISTSGVIPSGYDENFNGYVEEETAKEAHLRHAWVGAGFAETFEIPMVAGRNFDDRLEATEADKVLLNETAVKAFGWSDPIGKLIKQKGGGGNATVIGVMKDFHYNSLDRPIEPLVHWYGGKLGANNYLSIRIDPRQRNKVMSDLEGMFRKIPSRKAFSYESMSERVEKQYVLIDGILKVTNYVTFLILLIACMGLLGLSMLFARHRTKEIGIRKVLGSSVVGILSLLSKDFIKLVLIAIFIATPIAWYVMNTWLEDFAYRIDIQWWMFAVAGFLAVAVALLTIGFQSVRAARTNPVKSLRSE